MGRIHTERVYDNYSERLFIQTRQVKILPDNKKKNYAPNTARGTSFYVLIFFALSWSNGLGLPWAFFYWVRIIRGTIPSPFISASAALSFTRLDPAALLFGFPRSYRELDWLLSKGQWAVIFHCCVSSGSRSWPTLGLETKHKLGIACWPCQTSLRMSDFEQFSEIQTKVSQSRRFWHLGLGNSLLWGAVLGIRWSLRPLDATSTPLPSVVVINNVSRHWWLSPGGQNLPKLRTTGINISSYDYSDRWLIDYR